MRGLRHGFVKPHPDTTRLHPVHNARARPRAGAIGLGDGLIIDNEADLPRIGKGDQVSRRRVGEAEHVTRPNGADCPVCTGAVACRGFGASDPETAGGGSPSGDTARRVAHPQRTGEDVGRGGNQIGALSARAFGGVAIRGQGNRGFLCLRRKGGDDEVCGVFPHVRGCTTRRNFGVQQAARIAFQRGRNHQRRWHHARDAPLIRPEVHHCRPCRSVVGRDQSGLAAECQ